MSDMHKRCEDCAHSSKDGSRLLCSSEQVMAAHKSPAFAFHERDSLDVEHNRSTPERQKCGPEAKNFTRRSA
jgi:hypothetical protein